MSQEPPYPPTDPLAHVPAPAPSLRIGLAIGALVCGILSFCVPFLGVVAIVLGIIALVKASNEPERYGGKGMAIGGICTGSVGLLLVLTLLVSILLPSLARARELSRRTVCAANMKGIGLAIYSYANENDDAFPADISVLVDSGMVSPRGFRCPSASQSNYVYIPGLNSGARADTPVLFEPLENHGGDGGIILFVDGHAEFVPRSKYEQILAPYKSRAVQVDFGF